MTVLLSEKSPNRKVTLERDRDTQAPFSHVKYFSPASVLRDESARSFRDRTASLSEEEEAERGKRTECGGKGQDSGAVQRTPAVQETLLSRAMMLRTGLLTTRAGAEQSKKEKKAETEPAS